MATLDESDKLHALIEEARELRKQSERLQAKTEALRKRVEENKERGGLRRKSKK